MLSRKHNILYGSAMTCLLIAGSIFLVSRQPVSAQLPVTNHRYTLSWSDDFDGRELNEDIWSKIQRAKWNWQRYMSQRPEVFDLRRGRLRLFCKNNDGIAPNDTAPYLTGGISSAGKKTFTYGKIEVRARIHGAQGCWPAIWTKPEHPRRQAFPERTEIDIMEHLNHDSFVYQTVHSGYTHDLKQTTSPPNHTKAPIRAERYNVYTVEILPEAIIFSVNGTPTFTYPKIETDKKWQYEFGEESFLMLDMQTNSTWAGATDPSQLPAYMDIDWVRVYDLVE